jgi:hypothetical protein
MIRIKIIILIALIMEIFLSNSKILNRNTVVFSQEADRMDSDFKPVRIKDPFLSLFPKKEPEVKNVEQVVPVKKEEIKPPELSIQGLVWGKIAPQAIVNNKVVSVGDIIDEARIIGINKEGIRILFKNEIFFIRAQTVEKSK